MVHHRTPPHTAGHMSGHLDTRVFNNDLLQIFNPATASPSISPRTFGQPVRLNYRANTLVSF